jgi:general bacterial porin, GBP family
MLTAQPLVANAQSSVTLGGILDAGLLYANNADGHAAWSATSGQLAASRWLMFGSEPLGSSQRVIFRMMSPFSLQNGRGPGRAFNVAYVGLVDDRLGTLTAGRQWDTTIDLVSGFATSETWAGFIGSHVGDADNMNATFKVSNAIKYASPKLAELAGLSFGATYGFSNASGSGSQTNNRLMSSAAAFARGSFAASAGILQADRPGGQPAGALGSPAAGIRNDYANTFTTSHASSAGVLRQRIYLAGASYRLGSVTFGGLYSKVQFRYLDATGLSLDNYEANLTWQATPAWQAGIAYVRTDGQYSGAGTNHASPGWDQINLGTQYALSKRTVLYLLGVAQQGRHANAQIVGVSPSSTRRQMVVTSGMQQRF